MFAHHVFWFKQPTLPIEKPFNDTYAYFSSTSKTWLQHAKKYVEDVIEQFDIDKNSFVMEVASNDGYLLKFCKEKDPVPWY